MLPKKKIRIGCFDYTLKSYPCSASENHGDTDLEKKIINIFNNGNIQVLKETLCHEIEHVLLEDIVGIIKNVEKEEDMEEALVRLVNPRRMQCIADNRALFRWIWEL